MTPGRREGFTLLELLVVVTVIGILIGVAYLRLGPSLTRAGVRGAANALAGDLRQAQMLTVRHRQPIVIDVNTADMRYTIRNRPGDTVFISRAFGTGTDYPLDEFAAVPAAMELFPSGIGSADATFTVGHNGYRRQVWLSRAGQIRMRNVP